MPQPYRARAVCADTLHRFCKKEHDWGWKKFMELSKVLEGFTVEDTLIIKAQVQVIRCAARPHSVSYPLQRASYRVILLHPQPEAPGIRSLLSGRIPQAAHRSLVLMSR